MQGLIDVHHHILPPDYLAALGDRIGVQGLTGPVPEWTPALAIEAMDRNGIGAAITSISSPGVWFGDPDETLALARSCNEYAATLKRDHPDRFGFFAVLPLPAIDGSLSEIEHAFDQLDADGVVLLTHYGDRYLGDPSFAPVFEELDRRNAVVFVHPTVGQGWSSLPEIPLPALEFPFDTTRAIVNMLYEGTFLRCRNVRFVFSHAGGAIALLAERVARMAVLPKFNEHVPAGVRAELKRLYFDLALSANSLALSTLAQVADGRHVLYGSDYPHAGERTMAATLDGLAHFGPAFGAETHGRSAVADNARALFTPVRR